MRRALPFAALAAFTALAAAPPAASAAELELVPMLGLADLGADDDDVEYDSGIAVGVAFGGRLARIFSLHGQLNVHPLTVDDVPGVDSSGLLVTVAIAGLFNVVDEGNIRLQIGPVLGGFSMKRTFEAGDPIFSDEIEISVTGPLVALQAGLYFSLSPTVALGPTLQYGRMYPSEVCVSSDATETCDSDVDDDEGLSLLLAYASAMFTF